MIKYYIMHMKKYRICKNNIGDYKVQALRVYRVLGIPIWKEWCDCGYYDMNVFMLFKTRYYDSEKEAAIAIDRFIEGNKREEKRDTWRCQGEV